MAQSRASSRIDWGLFLLVAAASQGYFGLMPAGVATREIADLVAAILAILAIRELVRAHSAVRLSPLFIFLVLLMAAWTLAAKLLAQQPGYTFLVLLTMIVYVFLRQSTTERTLQTFALATSAALVPSVLGFFVPLGVPVRLYAGSQNGYAGYFPFNSWLGICAAATIVSVVTLLLSGGYMWWHLPAAAVALFALVSSKSATGSVACVVALGALALITVMRRTRAQYKPLIIIGVGIVVFLPLLLYELPVFKTLGEATGRDETFSYRTGIWQYGLKGVSESPYWGNPSHWSSYTKLDRVGAQNGFLEFALIGGVPATLALIAIVILAGYKLVVRSSLLLPFLAFGVVVNLSITHLTSPYVASLALWIAVGSAAGIAGDGTTFDAAAIRKGSVLH